MTDLTETTNEHMSEENEKLDAMGTCFYRAWNAAEQQKSMISDNGDACTMRLPVPTVVTPVWFDIALDIVQKAITVLRENFPASNIVVDPVSTPPTGLSVSWKKDVNMESALAPLFVEISTLMVDAVDFGEDVDPPMRVAPTPDRMDAMGDVDFQEQYLGPVGENAPVSDDKQLDPELIRNIMKAAPGVTEDDVRKMEPDEIALFTDLIEMNDAIKDIAVDLQQSAEQGGPSSVVGFFRLYMNLTKIGAGELSAITKIPRLRMISIMQETVEMTPGEMAMIKEVLLPRYQKWRALQNKPENRKREDARIKKRMEKKRKKTRVYDRLTGAPILDLK